MYSAVLLDPASQVKLENLTEEIKVNGVRLSVLIKNGRWKKYCHHMTIHMGPLKDYLKSEEKTTIGSKQTLNVMAIGISDKAVAVRVEGLMAGHSKNDIPHVTLAVSPDGKPVDSNKITNWSNIDKKIVLHGEVKELE